MKLSSEFARNLFSPFTDPATSLEIEENDNGVLFSFRRNGIEQSGELRSSESDALEITTVDGHRQSLCAYLASPVLADLSHLASIQQALYRKQVEALPWVAGPAIAEEEFYDNSLVAINSAMSSGSDRTSVLILDAPAGMGKTTLVERLAQTHAEEFLQRKKQSLALIVSSRGRRLSRLNDAIAATLQDLRAKIVYREIPVLVRLGLITLVIDGFDELVNQDGYDDAWGSLGELIESLQGGGRLVLSSRDTFFSEQEFFRRAQRGDELLLSRVEFKFSRLLQWGSDQVRRLLEARQVPDNKVSEVIPFFDDSSGLAYGRPVFVNFIADHLLSSDEPIDIDSLLPIMVEGFVDRENKILFREASTPSSADLLWRFFSELAIEMRVQERDWLEKDVVQFFLDAVLEEGGIPEEQRRQLVLRSGAVAFLEQAGDPKAGNRSFPHQVFSDSFFAKGLLRQLDAKEVAITSLLKIGVYGLDLSDTILAFSKSHPSSGTQESINWLLDFANEYPSLDPVAMNSVAFALTLCRGSNLQGDVSLNLQGITTGSASLAESEAPTIILRNSGFALLDLSDSLAHKIDTDQSVRIAVLRVTLLTKLGPHWDSTPTVLEIAQYSGKTDVIRDPREIHSWIERLKPMNTLDNWSDQSEGEKLLERLARRWLRRYYFDDEDILEEPSFGSPLWPLLKKVLMSNDRLVSKVTQTSGRRRELLHLRDPKGILERGLHAESHEQIAIQKLWKDVRNI